MRYFTKYIPPETKKKLAERERQRLERLYQKSREAEEAKRIDNL